ncbi:hypothetical protein ASZ78_014095 [Callipepla squamata]|uniref:Mitotic-spindle organizing protein 1 n=1 Tax=Callipepla squamata TaxID=9009 RepID=A0A226NHE4_CALSU|nr:hypothetical protein ASZ78_014095 [Callipepla squamata]
MASNAASINAVRETMEDVKLDIAIGGEGYETPYLNTLSELLIDLSRTFVLFEISRILNTGLDMETLSICVRLCEQGINPEALSSVIKELRKATEALKAAENMTS